MDTTKLLTLAVTLLFFLGCERPRTVEETEGPSVSPPVVVSPPRTEPLASETPESHNARSADARATTLDESDLEGEWKVNSVEIQGESLAPQPGMPEVMQFTNGVFTAFSNGSPIETFSEMVVYVDFSPDPAILDLTRQYEGRIETLPCLLELNGPVMRISMPMIPASKRPEDPLPRPLSFDTEAGRLIVITATRE